MSDPYTLIDPATGRALQDVTMATQIGRAHV